MFERFRQDVQRWIVPEQIADPKEVTLLRTLKLLVQTMPLRVMLWYRFGAWLYRKRAPFFPGIIQRLISRRFGLDISVQNEIGGGLYIPHPISTVISVKRMGSNCTIISNVTIDRYLDRAFPEIGDRVFIGAGARVLGGIRIGDDAVIGANAVVLEDVPAGTTVVGVPARPVVRKAIEPAAPADITPSAMDGE
jgi:serine O-acetyltransferase